MMDRQRGFSLIEMLVAMTVMLIVMASVLQMLSQTQQRFVTTASEEDPTAAAREGLDLMTREIRLSGYPPPSSYPPNVIQAGVNEKYVAATFVGGVLEGGGFITANPYSIQFMADIGIPAGCGQLPVPPGLALSDYRCTSNTGVVSVINYQLQVPTGGDTGGCAGLTVNAALTSPTLMRSQVPKLSTGAAVVPVFDPFVNNVMNCNLSQPIFTYCPAPPAAAVVGCPTMTSMLPSSLPAPRNTRVVLIRIQTQTVNRDPKTGQFYNVEFFNVAQRVNPDK